jgi:hypothetical protein
MDDMSEDAGVQDALERVGLQDVLDQWNILRTVDT